jgi:hypothetical protein
MMESINYANDNGADKTDKKTLLSKKADYLLFSSGVSSIVFGIWFI